MLFTSYGFIGFLLIVLVLYYILPKSFQKVILLLASFAFYALSGPLYLLYLFSAILTTFLAGRYMGKNIEVQKAYIADHRDTISREGRKLYNARQKAKRKRAMVYAIVINIGVLSVVKYTNFVIGNINALGGQLTFLDIALPLGISYYTLMSVGYLVDIFRGTIKAETNLLNYALFLSFFPHIVQGPISRYGELSRTLCEPHDFNSQNIIFGAERILFGFFKKLVIADRLFPVVSTIAGDPKTYRGAYILCLMFFYTLELYADFTGGIDITIGVAEMFGIKMTENFERPYFSKSLKEYWRRWHISMGTWFKDYLFFPIAMSSTMQKFSKFLRKHFGDYVGKRLPVYISSFIVWFMTGLWHGASWNFIVWGLLNYVILMISEEFEPLTVKFHEKFIPMENRVYQGFMVIRTMIMVSMLKIFDCYANVGDVFASIGSIFTTGNFGIFTDGSLLELGMDVFDHGVIFATTLLLFVLSMIQRRGSIRQRMLALPFAVRAMLISALFIGVLLLGDYGVGYDSSQFIYNRF
ncbi:MAG: MBOAT family protein [Lachnospiraceae bacterium]|nr:MBOAT family protein [Lachnospiraceae bacterium]